MMFRKKRGALVWVGVFLSLAGSGCVSREAVSREIGEARGAAYRQWEMRREAEKESMPLIQGKLSLEDALTLAVQNNKSLLATIQEKEIARGVVLESYSEALPRISASGAYTRLREVSSFDAGGTQVSLGAPDNFSVELEVLQPVFRGGAICAALRAAKVVELLSDDQVRGALQRTIYEVAHSYYDALLSQHLVTVFEETVQSAEANLRDVRLKTKVGIGTDFDVLRAEVAVSNPRAEMIKQRNNVDLAKSRLLKAMGVTQKGEVILSDELVFTPVKPVLEEAVRIAYENRPDLHASELDIKLQEEALRIAKSEYWPRIDAFFVQEWAQPSPTSMTDNQWDDTWNAGATVRLSIFDGLGREGRVVQRKATLEQSHIRLAEAEELAFLEIRQALLSLRNAEESVESQKLNQDRAAEALRLGEVGYRAGVNKLVEVLDARAALAMARALYYEAVYGHVISHLGLQMAMGILGPKGGEKGVEVPPAIPVTTETGNGGSAGSWDRPPDPTGSEAGKN
jgi:outer membrane protein